MGDPEPATTTNYRKRHLSTDLRASHGSTGRVGAWGQPMGNGRFGHALCNANTEVIDQAEVNDRTITWLYRRKPVVDELEECKGCAKKAAKLGPADDPESAESEVVSRDASRGMGETK